MKYLSIKEFIELGYLQELNRQFLHLLGLALQVNYDYDTDTYVLNQIWDCRDDPEGIIFTDVDTIEQKEDRIRKIYNIDKLKKDKLEARVKIGCDEETGVQNIRDTII